MEVGNRHRLAAVLAAFAVMLLTPASGLADSFATTDPATNVMFTSAQLNGTVNADPGSNYFFEYGARTCHDHRTQPTAVASGVQHVSAAVDNLTPGVTYCFHLVVNDILSGGGVTTHTGSDLNFTTQVPTVPATTGDATSVTSTSARLNGIVNVKSPNSTWSFQYGTTTYGTVTQAHPVGAGVTVVSLRVTGLSPRTKYHFRLVVAQGTDPTIHSNGADRNFRTSKFVLRKRRLRVSHRKVSIPLSCKGQSGATCSGTLRITVRGRRVRCAGGHFSLHAGQRQALKEPLRRRCMRLLGNAKHHRLRGSFEASFDSPQVDLRRAIRLFE